MFSDKILNRSLSESCLNSIYSSPVITSVYVEQVMPVSSENCGTQLRRRYFSTTYIENCVVPTQQSSWQNLTGLCQPDIDDYVKDLTLVQGNNTVIENCKSIENNQDIPMDIDETEESVHQICDIPPQKPILITDKCLKNGQLLNKDNLSKRKKSSRNNSRNYLKYAILLFLAVLCFWNFIDMILCINQDVNIENLQRELSKSIYLQAAAVEKIKSNLNITQWTNKMKNLAFFGPSGVGKTFTANIIKQHFGNERLVNEIYGEQLNNRIFLDDIVKNIKNCCYNLILIDDIKESNINQLKHFASSLPKDSVILLITIFNLNDQAKFRTDFGFEDLNKAKVLLRQLNFNEIMIVFTQFNEEEMRNWIRLQVKPTSGLSNTREVSDKIIEAVLIDHDVKTDGLKGLNKKIMMELQKFN